MTEVISNVNVRNLSEIMNLRIMTLMAAMDVACGSKKIWSCPAAMSRCFGCLAWPAFQAIKFWCPTISKNFNQIGRFMAMLEQSD